MNTILRIVWNEAAQAWVAVSELTKKHKKRASATAVAAALVAGMLSPFAQATETASDVARENVGPDKLKTDYYFRVTTTNTGEKEDLEHYRGCTDGNVQGACPDTEMNVGVLLTKQGTETTSTENNFTEENSDDSRLVLEGNKGIRLERTSDANTA